MKSRILCNHQWHTVEFRDDGTITSTGRNGGCGDVTEASRGLGAAILLGKRNVAGGCVALAALVNHGVPSFLQRPPGKEGYINLGQWDPLYTRFESNKVVQAAMVATRLVRDTAHAETFRQARTVFSKCSHRGDLFSRSKITFLGDQHMEAGRVIALTRASVWTIPLQHDWLESIFKTGIAVISRRFVCGIEANDPRLVWAISRESDGPGYALQRFQLQTIPLKLTRAA